MLVTIKKKKEELRRMMNRENSVCDLKICKQCLQNETHC